jgi:hypothetical protein
MTRMVAPRPSKSALLPRSGTGRTTQQPVHKEAALKPSAETRQNPHRQQPTHAPIDTRVWSTLRWTRGTRYYRVHLEQDLWSGWLLTLVNGRSGSRLGRARSKPVPSIEAALVALAHIAKRRRQRGYQLDV